MRRLPILLCWLLISGTGWANTLYGSSRLPLPQSQPAGGSGYPLQPRPHPKASQPARPLLSLAQAAVYPFVSYRYSRYPSDTLVPQLITPDTLATHPPTPDTAALFHWPGQFRQLAVDELGQLYLLTPQNELIKYAPDGQELFRYNNNSLGDLTVIDVANPFGILLFYPAHQRILLLDRTLNPQASLDLRQGLLLNAATVGLSRDNNIWVYDDWDFRLKLINARGEELLRTDDLRLSLQATETPSQVLMHRERVYLCFPNRGLAEFTNFGRFLGWIPIPADASQLHWSDSRLYYRSGQAYHAWPEPPEAELALPLPFSSLLQAWWQPDRLFLLTPEGASVWPR